MFVCKARHLVLAGGSKVRTSGPQQRETRLVGTKSRSHCQVLGEGKKGFFGVLGCSSVICHFCGLHVGY